MQGKLGYNFPPVADDSNVLTAAVGTATAATLQATILV